MNILLTVQYDGTDYNGWQRQSNTPHTIQEILEDALAQRLGAHHLLTAAGRTDAGVHALAMPCMFQCQEIRIPADRLPFSLNSLLPPDIRVVDARITADGFDPILSASSKTYRYQLDNAAIPNVFKRRYAWHIHHPLDACAMHSAAAHFVGTHDFKAFAAAGGSAKTSVRTIFALDVERRSDEVIISVTGNGFLYNMVRIITGTLVEVGLGKKHPLDIPAIILSRDRKKAGQTAPAAGLSMIEVIYSEYT
ncbi:MAG: tRNA pseudouridine(38-40) synthase TruA [Defluviitaleaceae bacterium]|nr:tRNA pseudouridine(38-40) synthase TruA [Defluviitaleaceae bacterium]